MLHPFMSVFTILKLCFSRTQLIICKSTNGKRFVNSHELSHLFDSGHFFSIVNLWPDTKPQTLYSGELPVPIRNFIFCKSKCKKKKKGISSCVEEVSIFLCNTQYLKINIVIMCFLGVILHSFQCHQRIKWCPLILRWNILHLVYSC